MKIKQTIRNTVLAGFLFFSAIGVTATLTPASIASADCGGVPTSVISCSQGGGTNLEETGVWGILLLAVNILTAGVGILALAGIVYGAILYTSAGGNPEQVKKARGIFINVVIGVVAFGIMFTLLNFLVPGGVFTA